MTKFQHTAEDSARWLKLYSTQQWTELSAAMLKTLQSLGATFLQLSTETQSEIDEFVAVFLFLMTRPEFVINDSDGIEFVKHNALIGNVVSMSAFKTTDAHLAVMGLQQNNLVRILTLYNARNHRRIERKLFFDVNPGLASLWYSSFVAIYHSSLPDQQTWQHLQEHLAQVDPRLTYLSQFHHMCFAASYIDPERDRIIKGKVNEILRGIIDRSSVQVLNRPNPRRIAVVTNRWFPSHSVYRNQYPWLKAIADRYELVLVHLGPLRDDTDKSLFREIRIVNMEGDNVAVGPIQQNDFAMAYYPEVGMCMESIFLSNMRIAPIQVTSYGHSVSTFGSRIDYWLAGVDVEVRDQLEHNYSERVVLLPGLGIANVRPGYVRQRRPQRQDRLVVNCSWYPQKVNHTLLGWLSDIARQSPPNVLFRLFAGGGLVEVNHFLPFARTVTAALGDRVQVVRGMPYGEYMGTMEEGALCLDAFHYGGCNTVVDSLHLRKPVVTLSGTKWYNRIGGAILRKVGMDELVAGTPQQYVDLAVRLINDGEWRSDVARRLEALDVDALLYDRPEDGQYFARAVDYLLENHARLQADGLREPISLEDQMQSTSSRVGS